MSFENLEKFEEDKSALDFHSTLPSAVQSIIQLLHNLKGFNKICIIQDVNVKQLYAEQFKELLLKYLCLTIEEFVLPQGEGTKNMQSVLEITDFLFQKKFNRQDVVIAMGGGVITDMVGFACSIYMRGYGISICRIKFILIPTTLLSQADASVGGKTGINNNYGKNQLGVINDAYQTIICTQFLHSQDKRNFLNGMGEIIKIAACFDRKLFELLEQYDYNKLKGDPILNDILKWAINLKQKIVKEDKYEANIRKILNYGHTLGHAIEFSCQGQLMHGECVSIGMVLANKIASSMNIKVEHYEQKIIKILKQYELPIELPDNIDVNNVVKYLQYDKKSIQGEINFVFIKDIGKHQFNTTAVPMNIIKKTLTNQCCILLQQPKIAPPIHSSKSIANRVLLLAALSGGITTIHNFHESDDTIAMLKSLQLLNLCEIHTQEKHTIQLEGCDGILKVGQFHIDVKESGTTARFLLPIIALMGDVTMKSEQRMQERPIFDLIEAMNLKVEYLNQQNHLPFRIVGEQQIPNNIKIKSKTSSQFVSALLMCSPLFGHDLVTIEITDNEEQNKLVSESFIDMTIALMSVFKVNVERENKNIFKIHKSQYISPKEYTIEPDATALTYDVVHIALNGGTLETRSISPLQGDTQFLQAVEQMGITIIRQEHYFKIIHKKPLIPCKINCLDFSDTFISLALIMASIKGESRIEGIANQRVKECDRVAAMADNLNNCGVICLQEEDALTIISQGFSTFNGYQKDILINTYDDHRIAMGFSILAGHFQKIHYQYRLIIDNRHCVKKTFPLFYDHITSLGLYYTAPTQENSFLQNYQYYKQPIILIGMRGSGKTSLSQAVSKALNLQYISIDNLITENVSEFVQQHGWSYFRKREQEVLIEVLQKYTHNVIIDCGGGIVENNQNVLLLKNKKIIFIEKCIKQVILDLEHSHRPCIGNLEEVYERRYPIYEQLAKYIFTIPQSEDFRRIEEMFIQFVGTILYLTPPKHRIYAKDSSFLCLFYDQIQELNKNDYQQINYFHNAIEIRLDNCNQSLQEIRQTLQDTKLHLTIPLIITFRTIKQGGYFKELDQYHNKVQALQKSFINDYFDIESDQFNCLQLSPYCQYILSMHIYGKQNKIQILTLVENLKQIAELNHNQILFIKLAIHQDAYPPELVYQEISKQFQNMKYVIPSLVISMGDNTVLYRTLNQFMVPLSFLKPTAAGQMSLQQLTQIREITNYKCPQYFHIFGKDLSLSRSDTYHNARFTQKQKIFTKISVDNIKQTEQYIEDRYFQGASITMPFKQQIGKYVNEKSIEVDLIGNVINTIIKYEDRIVAFNTDWWGIYWPIFRRLKSNSGKCLLIGNGATAKTALFVAQKLFKMEVVVYGRNVEEFSKENELKFMKIAEDGHKFSLVISTVPPKCGLEFREEWLEALIFVAHQGEEDFRIDIRGSEMFECQALEQIHLYNGKSIMM